MSGQIVIPRITVRGLEVRDLEVDVRENDSGNFVVRSSLIARDRLGDYQVKWCDGDLLDRSLVRAMPQAIAHAAYHSLREMLIAQLDECFRVDGERFREAVKL